MHSKPVGWFEIYVHDMSRAKAFYEAVFGFTFEQLESPDPAMELWAFPGPMDDGHGASGALVRMDDGPAGAGGIGAHADSAAGGSGAGREGGGVDRQRRQWARPCGG